MEQSVKTVQLIDVLIVHSVASINVTSVRKDSSLMDKHVLIAMINLIVLFAQSVKVLKNVPNATLDTALDMLVQNLKVSVLNVMILIVLLVILTRASVSNVNQVFISTKTHTNVCHVKAMFVRSVVDL